MLIEIPERYILYIYIYIYIYYYIRGVVTVHKIHGSVRYDTVVSQLASLFIKLIFIDDVQC